jgi:3',5'-cyclic-nucleotide phosphodiesterase
VTKERAQGLVAQAYRIYKEYTISDSSFLASKRTRKMSWVGVDEEKPFAYLREAMVSNLMSGICSPETNFTPDLSEIINNG